MPKAVVIIPTYNEKENIQILIEKIRKEFANLQKWNPQILVVDGNSPDGTATAVKKLARKHPDVHLIVEKKKRGLGAAYLVGMKHAFDRLKADVVITMDADLSHDPAYLPKFLKLIETGCDFIVGARYIKGGSIPQAWGAHRKFLSVFGNYITQVLLGSRQIQDWTTGYRAVSKAVFVKVRPQMEKDTVSKGYTFNISFAHHALESGFRPGQIPIHFVDRKAGKSKLGLEYLFYTPLFLIRTRLKKYISLY